MRGVFHLLAGAAFWTACGLLVVQFPGNPTRKTDADLWRLIGFIATGLLGFWFAASGFKLLRGAGRLERMIVSIVTLAVLTIPFGAMAAIGLVTGKPLLFLGSAAMTVFCPVAAVMVFRKFWRGD